MASAKLETAALNGNQSPFDIVSDQLVAHCPKLTNSIERGSYILPPRFSYRNPDNPKYGDEETRQWDKSKPEMKHRAESESVRPITDAIVKLIRCGTGADPFLAIEHLDLKMAEQDLIPHLLGGDQRLIDSHRPCIREFDVVLLGERIGAIVLEIKGSEYAQDFGFRNRQLPERYAKAFEQLHAANSLFSLIAHGAKFQIPNVPSSIRKIVITPRLKKSRYDQWFAGLNAAKKSAVNNTVGSTRQWFEEDSANDTAFDKLRTLIEEPGYSINPHDFRRGIRILALLKAWPIFKNFPDPQCRMSKLESLFSERRARLDDFMALQLQNTDIVAEKSKKKRKGSKNCQHALIEIHNKAIVLTDEQDAALGGPDHQLIIGTAGTGKTVVLSSRAIDCLERGRSVLVLTTESYMETYRDQLGPAGAKFEIRSWPRQLWSTLSHIPNCHRIIWDIYRHNTDVVELASKLVSSSSECGQQLFRYMDDFDDVILDDALEYTKTVERRMNTNTKSLLVALAMMIYAREYSPRQTTVWIGFDQGAIEWRHDRHPRIYRDTMERLRANGSISSILLTRVMRNGEEIFNLAYGHKYASQVEPYKPSCGHKIVGDVHREIIRPETSSHTFDDLWRKTNTYLEKYLHEQKYKRNEIAIIVGGTGSYEQTDKVVNFLLRKCGESQIPAKSLDFSQLHHANLSGSESSVSDDEDEKVLIDFWHQVSSKEWPIVIHVEMIDFGRVTRSFDAVRIHRQYRARTRAVSELVEIRVVPSTTRKELLKYSVKNCCSREIELYREENLNCLDGSNDGRMRYFPSNIHDFHGKRKCSKFTDGTFHSEKRRSESLDFVANVALQLRDDLYRDMDQEKRRISRKARFDYETRLFSKTRKRWHSVGCLREDARRHPALLLDYDLFEIITRGQKFPMHEHHTDGRLGKLEEIEAYFKDRSSRFKIWTVKRDIIHLMEKVLRWKLQGIRKKEERLKENDRHQNIYATALDSFKDIEKFS